MQGQFSDNAVPCGLLQHLSPAGAHRLRYFAGGKQAFIKCRNERFCAAYIEGVSHSYHTADASLEQPCRHAGKKILCLAVNHTGLAGVHHHEWDVVFRQQLGKQPCVNGVRLAAVCFKNKLAFRGGIQIPGRRGHGRTVAAVTVKMYDMIVAGVAVKHLPQLLKGRRTQDVHSDRQAVFADVPHQAVGQYVIAYIVFSIRTGDDIQNVDGVLGRSGRQGRWVADAGELPVNAAAQGQPAVIPAVQGFPWPGHDLGRIACNLNAETLKIFPLCVLIPVPHISGKQCVKNQGAPCLHCLCHARCQLGIHAKRDLQIVLQVPPQCRKELFCGMSFHREFCGIRQGDRRSALHIHAADHLKHGDAVLVSDMMNLNFQKNDLLTLYFGRECWITLHKRLPRKNHIPHFCLPLLLPWPCSIQAIPHSAWARKLRHPALYIPSRYSNNPLIFITY